ncbi:MAG: hypothetical protein OXH57_05210 [Ekhidna sp.]|nr:hypothetical protein [Ekhidna sp.]
MKKSYLLALLILIINFSCSDIDGDFSCSDIDGDVKPTHEEQLINLSRELNLNLKVDESVDPQNSINFQSLDDLKDFLLLLDNQMLVEEDQVLNNPSEILLGSRIPIPTNCCTELDGLRTGSIGAGFARLIFSIVVSDGRVTRFQPYLSGWTLGAGYTSGNYFAQYGSDSIEIETSGTLDFTLFWKGIGTIYQKEVHYNIIIKSVGGEVKTIVLPLYKN